jgi:hypothetical protein
MGGLNVPGVLPTCGNQMTQFGLGGPGAAGEIPGFVRLNELNANVRLTKVLFAANPVVQATGAESLTIVSETAASYIPNLPDAGSLSLSPQITGSCSYVNIFGQTGPGATACEVKQADSVWSYTNLLLQLSYPAAFGSPVNLTPSVFFGMNITGDSPIFARQQSGTRAANFSLTGEYQQNLRATINYAAFFGGAFRNTSQDKDFIGLNVAYSF